MISAIVAVSSLFLLLPSCAFASDIRTQEKKFVLDGIFNPKQPQSQLRAYLPNDTSLTFKDRQFYLNGQDFRIMGGSLHYFRIPEGYWRHRLLLLKNLGLNTVTVYVPWNLHEEYPNHFNFQGNLNIRKFLQLTHDLGLHVLLRPGPYICAEWEFGGLPAWLLRDPDMEIRSNYPNYINHVRSYFSRLFQEISGLQYYEGGPIIAVQVENEFGSYGTDNSHLYEMKAILKENGVKELFITSDGSLAINVTGIQRVPFYTESLTTANFFDIHQSYQLFLQIMQLSSDFPLMVTEFWSGWFDHWGNIHANVKVQEFSDTFERLLQMNASFNFYMFHGGTSFGFMAGANHEKTGYQSDVTSYDYDTLVSESGEPSPKYNAALELMNKYGLRESSVQAGINTKVAYDNISANAFIDFEDLLSLVEVKIRSEFPVNMENLNYTPDGYGQNFGFTFYTTVIPKQSSASYPMNLLVSVAKDRNEIFLDFDSLGIQEANTVNFTIPIDSIDIHPNSKLGILVENRGRLNYDYLGIGLMNNERKGLITNVTLEDSVLKDWLIYPLDFNKEFITKMQNSAAWRPLHGHSLVSSSPHVLRFNLHINGDPDDTFLDMSGWNKGLVMVNEHNIGRFWQIGPQQTLYLPGPFLHTGDNTIMVFEQHAFNSTSELKFKDMPILG